MEDKAEPTTRASSWRSVSERPELHVLGLFLAIFVVPIVVFFVWASPLMAVPTLRVWALFQRPFDGFVLAIATLITSREVMILSQGRAFSSIHAIVRVILTMVFLLLCVSLPVLISDDAARDQKRVHAAGVAGAVLVLWFSTLPHIISNSSTSTRRHILGYAILGVAMPGQLVFTILFGVYFGTLELGAQLASCATYPLVIGLFKGLWRFGLWVANVPFTPALRVFIEVQSLTLAALPYRIVFLGISDWNLAIAVLALEFTYKILKYCGTPLVQRSSFLKTMLSKLKPSRLSFPRFASGTGGGGQEKDSANSYRRLSELFFVQELHDTTNTIVAIVCFSFLRNNRSVYGDLGVSDQVIWFELAGLALEGVVLVIIMTVSSRLKLESFRPIEFGAKLYSNHLVVATAMQTVALISVFASLQAHIL